MRLDVLHIAKQYAGKPVLKDCSFSFDRTGTYILMGSNGCGKSTLLRICALLEDPDGGTLTYSEDGGFLAPDLALKRRITLVLPKIGIFNTTVRGNVAYGLKLRGINRHETDRRVLQALSYVGLEHKIDQHARTLSSGESQRVGIARSLVIEPDVLFLDEPTASIDQENMEIVEGIIKRMKQEARTMVIMTTHDRDQAERLADVLLVMKDGKIEKR